MKTKGGRNGKFSTKRMASMPRWGKARPRARVLHHLTPYERLALRAACRRKDQDVLPLHGTAAATPPPAAAAAAASLPPSLLAERLMAWGRRAAAAVAASLSVGARRGLGIAARPWLGLTESIRTAFAPVKAEGERQRGAMAFHGLQPQAAPPPPAAPSMPMASAQAVVAAALAELPDKGDSALPDDLQLLAALLDEELPAADFRASDMVRDCFAQFGTSGLPHRALLAVAIRLTSGFGLPGHLPLASDRAWRMLDPETFEDEMAAQLVAIKAFISDWQKTQQSFLCLEFAEIDLIEWLFECLHPARHSDLLFEVMNFKVLSNRRQGILRRIPHRVRKLVKDLGGGPEAVLYAAGARAYLDRVATTHGFTPLVETAAACLEEVEKVLEKLKPPALPDATGAGDGQALARITPVKMPASELAERAIAGAQAPTAAQPVPPLAPPLAPPAAPQPLATRPLPPAPAIQAPAAPSSPLAPISPAPPSRPEAEGVRPATVRLQPKHIRAGAVLTIPSRSAGRLPLGRMFSCGGENIPAKVPAISVKSEQTRPGTKPTRFPGPVNAVIPSSLPQPALPPAESKPAAARAVTGRVNLTLPGRPAPVTAPTTAQPAAPATAPQPAPQSTRPTVVLKPAAPKAQAPVAQAPVAQAPAPVVDTAPSPATAENVTKLTMVQKRRLPITQALKRQSVMRVLRGEDAEAVAQSIGISRPKLDDWVDKFVAAGAGALSSGRKRKSDELTVDTLRAKLAEVLATAQLIEQVMETSLPRRPLLLPPPADAPRPRSSRRPRKEQG